MVTIPAGLVVDVNEGLEGTTAVGFRRAIGALLKQSTPGVPDAGRLGSAHFAVTGPGSSMEYSVSGGGIVLTRGDTNGAYLVGMPPPA